MSLAASPWVAIAVLLLSSSASVVWAQVVPIEQLDRLHTLITENTLDLPRSHPFHIKISFTLNDLMGQEKEKGTVENWWSAQGKKAKINAPSYTRSDPEDVNEKHESNRESYLADELLQSFLHPAPIDFAHGTGYTPVEVEMSHDGLSLLCLVRRPSSAPSVTPEMSRYCVSTGTDTLIEEFGAGDMHTVRELPRVFHGVAVPSRIVIYYLGRVAISGTIETLEDLTTDYSMAGVDSRSSNIPNFPVDSTIMAGFRLSSRTPSYPKAARKAHQHGSVTISAIITTEGTLRDLDIIATPNDLFSQSALEAVGTWTYKPYLLSGKPTEVDTTIYVNYNLGR